MAKRVRDARTGQFVPPQKAITDPSHTIRETVKPPKKKK